MENNESPIEKELNNRDLFLIFQEEERLYIESKQSDDEWCTKHRALKKLVDDTLSKPNFDIDDYKKTREFAISNGGFLTNGIRRHLYKALYGVKSKKSQKDYKFVFIKKDSENYNDTHDVFTNLKEPVNLKCHSFDIVDKDVPRSKINQIYSSDKGYGNINKSLKQMLTKLLNTISSINDKTYNYYQGYHDIALFFLMLFIDNFETAVSVTQLFSEFNLKEYLTNEKEYENAFDFMKVTEFFKDVLKACDKGTSLMIQFCHQGAMLDFLITLFAHRDLKVETQYRLFDYFVFSHPAAVYYLTAAIVVDCVKVILKETWGMFPEEALHLHFQKLDYNSLDFDFYIKVAEQYMMEHPPSKILENHPTMKFYPLYQVESYVEKAINKRNSKKSSLQKIFNVVPIMMTGVTGLLYVLRKKNII